MSIAATVRRGLLVDVSSLQRSEGDDMSRWAADLTAALLAVPGAVRALLLDPGLPLAGRLPRAVLTSPLLRWSTATTLREAAGGMPAAYLVPAPPGGAPGATLLPQAVAERELPLVMVLPPPATAAPPVTGEVAAAALARVGLELYRHADLVLATSSSAQSPTIETLGVDPSRVVALPGEPADAARLLVEAVGRLEPGAAIGHATPRLALVSALPPSDAPSAGVAVRLAEALAPRCHLDLATEDEPDPAWLDRLGVRRLAVEHLDRGGLAWSYDAVVHVLGSSAADLPALRSARRVPGIAWFHDLRLAEPHRVEARATTDPAATLAAQLRRCYADRAPAPLLDALDAGNPHAFDAAAERRFGLLLTCQVMAEARAAVAGSSGAARRLRLDQGPSGPCPPIAVIDGTADPRAAAQQLLDLVGALDNRSPRHAGAVA